MNRKVNGISLLEILLVLAIIATITTMSVRFFLISKRSMRVEQAMTQIKNLSQASYQWLQGQRQENFSGSASGAGISIDKLIQAGFVQKKEVTDPWGGEYKVEPGSDNQFVKISVTKVSQMACVNLRRQLKNVTRNHTVMIKCASKGNNTYSGEF